MNYRQLKTVEAEMAIRLGEQVKTLRQQAGLTQTQLAALMGTSQNGIFRLENGVVTPHISTVLHALAALKANLHLDLTTEGAEVKLEIRT